MDLTEKLPMQKQSSPIFRNRVRAAINGRRYLRKALYLPLTLRRYWIERDKNDFIYHFNKTFERAPGGQLILRLPDLDGEFEVDLRSSTTKRILREGVYEPDLVGVMKQFVDRNRDVIDVGANIGMISVFLSHYISKNSKVLSVEPIPSALKLLKRNLERNNCCQNTIIFEGMAGNESGEAEIETIPGMEEYSSAAGIRHAQAPKDKIIKCRVPVKPLDILSCENNISCGFLKVDTEGYEMNVFEGARSILRNQRPVVFSEASDSLMQPNGTSVKALVELLESYDYTVSNAASIGEPIQYPFDGEIIALPNS